MKLLAQRVIVRDRSEGREMETQDLRACWYKHLGTWRGGKFHQWGQKAVESQLVTHTYAIIEDEETGAIMDPEPWHVHFGVDPNNKP